MADPYGSSPNGDPSSESPRPAGDVPGHSAADTPGASAAAAAGPRMADRLGRAWWLLAVRGVLAIVFGVLAWIWPGITLFVLIIMFGAYALVDGIGAIIEAIRGVPGKSRAWLAVTGVFGVLAGLAAFLWPGATSLILLMLIAAWAVVTGIFEIIAAIALRREITGEGWHIVSGVVSVAFGVVLFVWPARGILALVWLIGISAVVFGVTMLVAAFQLRRLGRGGGRTVGGAGDAAGHQPA